jgi:O-antigen/teichoic acid export membrane protein
MTRLRTTAPPTSSSSATQDAAASPTTIRTAAAAITHDDMGSPVTTARPKMRKMLVSASGSAVLQGLSNLIGFGVTVLLARFLGSTGYGSYALAFAWSMFLLIPAILGLNTFLVRGIAVYEVQERWSLMKGLLFRTNQLVLLTSSIIAVSGTIIAVTLLSPSFRGPFCVAMLLVPLTALTLLRQGAMQAFGRIVIGQVPEYLIRPLLIVIGVIALEAMGALTPTTALGANATGVAVACLVGALLLRRALPTALRAVQPAYVTREWLRASLPMMLISGVTMANGYAAILVVGSLDGTRNAGIYSVVQKGAELIIILLMAANMPLAPAIARLHAHGDRQGLEQATEHVARATLLVSAPVAIAFMVFPGIYLTLFGPSFAAGATALTIVAFGQLVNAMAGPSGNLLIMTGEEKVAVRAVAAGLLANVVLAILLVPSLGVTGGAVAYASSLILWNIILVVLARRRLGINVTAFRWWSIQRSPHAAET